MKQIKSHTDLETFRQSYETVSGLPVPMDYLIRSKVYAFYSGGAMVGGFVIGSGVELRTIEVFISPENQDDAKEKLNDLSSYCEVCCFWIKHKYRKHLLTNIKCWLRMAYAVKYQQKPFVLFGTNSKGLAYVYGYPDNSLLLTEDNVSDRDTYVFLARRKDFAGGVWEIIRAKLLQKDRVRSLELKHTLRAELQNEIQAVR